MTDSDRIHTFHDVSPATDDITDDTAPRAEGAVAEPTFVDRSGGDPSDSPFAKRRPGGTDALTAANEDSGDPATSAAAPRRHWRSLTDAERLTTLDGAIAEAERRRKQNRMRDRQELDALKQRRRRVEIEQNRETRRAQTKQESIARYHLADSLLKRLAALPEHAWENQIRDVLGDLSEIDRAAIDGIVQRLRDDVLLR